MKSKRKAKELYNRFISISDQLHKYPMCHDTAKQCAIICCEEIIKSYNLMMFTTELEYWNKVKEEVDKI